MNAGEYVTYLKELTVRIEQSRMSVEFWPAALSLMARPMYYMEQSDHKSEGSHDSREDKKTASKPTAKMIATLQDRLEGKKGNTESKRYVKGLGDLGTLSFDEAKDAIDKVAEMEGWK